MEARIKTYLFLVQAHQPVAHVVQHVQARLLVLITQRWMGEVDARNALMLPASAKRVLIIEQTQLLDNVIHDQVRIDLRFVRHVLFVSLTQLADLINIEAQFWINSKHAVDEASQFLAVSVGQLWNVALADSLEQLI